MRFPLLAPLVLLVPFAASACADGDSPSALCKPAPESTTSVLAEPPWALGVERDIEIQIGRSNTSREVPTGLSRTPVKLTVEDNIDDGWSFLWAAEPTLLDDLDAPEAVLEQGERLLAEAPQQLIRYRLSNERAWLGVDNPDELRESLVATKDLLTELTGNDRTLQEAFNVLTRLPDENLEMLFAREPQLLHFLEGIEVSVDEVVEFRDFIPNALGGAPFPATTTIKIVDLVDNDGCVAIEVRTIPDPEGFVDIMIETLQQTFPAGTTDDELESAATSFDVENRYVGQYDYESGFFQSVTRTQRISDGQEERIDTRIVRDVTED
jgi:hypothetical protein